jgi:hypothetical protein
MRLEKTQASATKRQPGKPPRRALKIGWPFPLLIAIDAVENANLRLNNHFAQHRTRMARLLEAAKQNSPSAPNGRY